MNYTISTIRSTPAGLVLFGIVTDQLQRVTVSMPRKRTTADNIAATIDHALAAVYRPPAQF